MDELYPADTDLDALSGTYDAEQEVEYPTIGESAYYTTFYKMLYRLLDVARRAGDLRVVKDGDLTFAVRAGRYFDGDTAVNYAGATAQALTDDATNYIYLTAAGTLTVNTTGFPDPPSATPHLPLATIATGTASAAGVSGEYNHEDIADYRGRALLSVPGKPAAIAVEANTAGSGSPNVLTAGESGKVLTNEGATEANYHALPEAAAGLRYTFVVADADGMRITAAAGDTIRILDTVSIAGGYIESTTIGAAVTLTAINATEWIAHPVTPGAWAVETS